MRFPTATALLTTGLLTFYSCFNNNSDAEELRREELKNQKLEAQNADLRCKIDSFQVINDSLTRQTNAVDAILHPKPNWADSINIALQQVQETIVKKKVKKVPSPRRQEHESQELTSDDWYYMAKIGLFSGILVVERGDNLFITYTPEEISQFNSGKQGIRENFSYLAQSYSLVNKWAGNSGKEVGVFVDVNHMVKNGLNADKVSTLVALLEEEGIPFSYLTPKG